MAKRCPWGRGNGVKGHSGSQARGSDHFVREKKRSRVDPYFRARDWRHTGVLWWGEGGSDHLAMSHGHRPPSSTQHNTNPIMSQPAAFWKAHLTSNASSSFSLCVLVCPEAISAGLPTEQSIGPHHMKLNPLWNCMCLIDVGKFVTQLWPWC